MERKNRERFDKENKNKSEGLALVVYSLAEQLWSTTFCVLIQKIKERLKVPSVYKLSMYAEPEKQTSPI